MTERMAGIQVPELKASQVAGPMPMVLYIMGTGRSGTTILDVILSDNPGMVSVGEVTHIFRDGFIEKKPCACGQAARSCALWGQVWGKIGLAESSLGHVNDLFRSVGWHKKFFALFLGFMPSSSLETYQTINRKLFMALSQTSGAHVVVDSSKYPARALALSRMFPNRIKVICLTRAPEGLLAAFRKQDIEQTPKGYFATLLYYTYVLLTCRLVMLSPGVDVVPLRYEDLTRTPVETLGAIERWSGLNLSQAKGKIQRQAPLLIGHMVTGNRLRNQGSIIFKPSTTAKRSDGARARLTIMAMQCVRFLLRF